MITWRSMEQMIAKTVSLCTMYIYRLTTYSSFAERRKRVNEKRELVPNACKCKRPKEHRKAALAEKTERKKNHQEATSKSRLSCILYIYIKAWNVSSLCTEHTHATCIRSFSEILYSIFAHIYSTYTGFGGCCSYVQRKKTGKEIF